MSTALRITLDEYHRMIEQGAFVGTKRAELIHGEIIEMSPIGTWHAGTVTEVGEWSIDHAPRETVRVRVQQPIVIREADSEPEPDLAWVSRKQHLASHPCATDVFLLIEVAETSLQYDRNTKGPLYSAAGIEDYWIVNIPARRIEVYRRPAPDGYLEVFSFGEGESVSPLRFPEIRLDVARLFAAVDAG
jgi:Uma2 family endonuclease